MNKDSVASDANAGQNKFIFHEVEDTEKKQHTQVHNSPFLRHPLADTGKQSSQIQPIN